MKQPDCLFLLAFICFALPAFSQKMLPAFNANEQPLAPDYANPEHWCVLPFTRHVASQVPAGEHRLDDSLKIADVFYIYPTIYTKGKTWNADILHQKRLRKRIQKLPVRLQASPFNHIGRIYVPWYRQAILKSFDHRTGDGGLALDFAYQDVKRAFEYFLANYNHNRPLLIAGHSQGALHARRLIREFFDTTKTNQLVAAWLFGFGVDTASYLSLKPCKTPEQTGCYLTWASFKSGYNPVKDTALYGNFCINPISWRADLEPAKDRSGILLNIQRKKLFESVAQVSEGHYLEVKTRLPFFRRKKVLHLVDVNLFWDNIRNNAALRLRAWERDN